MEILACMEIVVGVTQCADFDIGMIVGVWDAENTQRYYMIVWNEFYLASDATTFKMEFVI